MSRRRPLAPFFFVLLLVAGTGWTQPAPAREVTAVRAASPPQVDGRLDDSVWQEALPASGFLQRDPDEGKPASEETRVRFAYDDNAFYVAAELLDRDPRAIIRQLSRRDAVVEGDILVVYLDPHHDRLTGAGFAVSAAGVQRDALIYNDSFLDYSWDAVWESAVAVDDGGWTVEMRIPMSQLRFPKAERHTWGVNVERIIKRRNESDWLQLVPKNESGLASRMAVLEGIAGLEPPVTLQWMPYVTSRAEFIAPARAGNPFNDGSRTFASGGIDLKYGLSSSLTLDATFNPDFGQVEVDPAVVNLTAFETFFEEKRPFFTEGANVFGNFGKSGASAHVGFFRPEPTLFYSRRVGRVPQGRPNAAYADLPASTTILGAVKLVGRTAGAWTIGALEAVTGRESARVSDGVHSTRQEVEPLTNYAVVRAQRELGRRAGIGVLATSVVRDGGDEALSKVLVDRATMAGVDGHVFLDPGRNWVIHGGLAGSTVQGSQEAIARVQRAEQRYYQRPDAPHVRFDGSKTSLSGWTGNANLNRNSGNLTVNLGIWGMSPGFEVNDAGYSTQTDRAGAHAMVQLRKLTPDRWTRERSFWVSKWWTWNYGNESQGDGWQAAGTVQFRNFWTSNVLLSYAKKVWDDKLTRGGPTVIRPGNRGVNIGVVTDRRRKMVVSLGTSYTARDYDAWNATGEMQVAWRPIPALTVSSGPSFRRNVASAQYLSTIADPLATSTFGNRYVFGELDQTEFSMITRVNLATSPRTSLQVYLQPLVSAGDYGAIKEVAARSTYDFVRYGIDGGTLEPFGDRLRIDPDAGGPASPFSIARPDFNVRSLRANAVFRWEFRPGSSLFIAWTETRRETLPTGDLEFGDSVSRVFTAPADDVLLVKVSYWFGTKR
ncbi:MAG: carbohydrate binding family 9 domain-containing protein [Acidobacteria bacterium]|nr:carbohydrate binding family 9 domain-containing protein [Acidobacteriota bacterium]